MTDSSANAEPRDVRTSSVPSKIVVTLRAGLMFAIANIICVMIFSIAWVNARREPKVISVTGSAKKAIVSDLIVWNAYVSATDPDLTKAYTALSSSTEKTLAFLRSQGIAETQIKVGSISTRKRRARDEKGNETEKISSYELSQSIEVTSNDVGRVSDVARKVTGLIKDGVQLESSSPRFLYTKMADLKITMLAEATKDAKTRAEQIAGNSGATLGPVVEARMGVMQINAVNDNDVSGSGVNDTSSLEKEITAVVSAKFGLE